MNDQSKTISVVSYITIIGWIIALIMRQNESPKSELARFHLRQSLGIHLLSFALSIAQLLLNAMYLGFMGNLLTIAVFVLWLLGLLAAIQGDFKRIPFIGQWCEDNFNFIT